MGINSVYSQMRGFGTITTVQTPEMLMEKILAVTGYVKSSNETLQESLMKQYGHLDIVALRATLFKIYGMPENVAYLPNWGKALIASAAAAVAPVKPAVTLPTLPKIEISTAPTAAELAAIAKLKKDKEDAQKALDDKAAQKKMLMYGGIGVGVLVLGGIIWYVAK